MKMLRVVQIFILFAFFSVQSMQAQGPDEDGPAPPPAAAPISGWVPIMCVVAVIFAFYVYQKSTYKCLNKKL